MNFATDTIYIRANEWLYFSYKLNVEQVYWAQFTIVGKETSRFEDKNGGGVELRWYFEGKESGTFPLEMKLFTRSQTGSIGDCKSSAKSELLVQQNNETFCEV